MCRYQHQLPEAAASTPLLSKIIEKMPDESALLPIPCNHPLTHPTHSPHSRHFRSFVRSFVRQTDGNVFACCTLLRCMRQRRRRRPVFRASLPELRNRKFRIEPRYNHPFLPPPPIFHPLAFRLTPSDHRHGAPGVCPSGVRHRTTKNKMISKRGSSDSQFFSPPSPPSPSLPASASLIFFPPPIPLPPVRFVRFRAVPRVPRCKFFPLSRRRFADPHRYYESPLLGRGHVFPPFRSFCDANFGRHFSHGMDDELFRETTRRYSMLI